MKKCGKILVIVLLLLLTFFSFLLIDNHINKLKAFDIEEPIYYTDELIVENLGLLKVIDWEIDKEGICRFLLYDGSNDIYIEITEYDIDYNTASKDFIIRLNDYFSSMGLDVYLSVWGDAVEYIYKLEMEYTLNQISNEDMYGEGYNDGYKDGYNNALNKGYNNGYNVGYGVGNQVGYEQGYREGKSDGLQEQYNYHRIDKVNDNLKDILDLENKKFYDNVGKYIPRDNDVILSGGKILNNTIAFAISTPPNIIMYKESTTKSNRLPCIYDYNLDEPHFYFTNEIVTLVYVDKNELITQDIDGFKAWLLSNNFTITYELAEPQEIILTDEEIAQFPSYKIGFNDGYEEAEATIDGLSKVVPSVFGSIWLVVSDFLSIEIFGISLWSILLLLSGISLLILLLKLVL